MIHHHQIPITRTARFCTLGDRTAEVKEVWFVLHGYGQLAGDFIKEFEGIHDESRFIVAPEALSRFYAKRNPTRVGASWMTRESREHEINDYLAYLNQVALFVYDMLDRRVPSTVLGFSQGATTASRWVTMGRFPAKRLILWGGDIAQDLDLAQYGPVLNQLSPTLIVGDNDHYINSDRLEQEETRLKENQISYELITFKGGHELEPNVLRTIA